MPSKLEAKPSQAKPSQAKPSQARLSKAKPKEQTKPHRLTLRFTPAEFMKLTAAAKYSHQTLAEWIKNMCQLATMD
jgi:hypothetical protein